MGMVPPKPLMLEHERDIDTINALQERLTAQTKELQKRDLYERFMLVQRARSPMQRLTDMWDTWVYWFADFYRNLANFFVQFLPDDFHEFPNPTNCAKVAEDAFPLHYRSPYIPPPLSDEGRAFIGSLALMASAGKITLFAEHQDIVPYTPPVEPMPYTISVKDTHEMVMREEDGESGKAIGETVLPEYDERSGIPPRPQVDPLIIGKEYR